MAVIGCANQGSISVNEIARLGEKIVAFADVDDRQFAKAEKLLAESYPEIKFSAIQQFFDYRKMLDKVHKQIDAVFICIPDHHHAVAAMMAMQLGKAVYCEKPLAHSVDECRTLAAAAKKYKVVTQLGNQGHSKEGIRVLCEYIWAGAIGNVTEVHAWAPTGRGGTGGRLPKKPVPAGLHWDEWIGPAAFRDYHDELHPALWRSWWEFGDGSLGDWGCHNVDGAFWALNLGQPTSAEAVEQVGGSAERFPLVNAVRWDFPARGQAAAGQGLLVRRLSRGQDGQSQEGAGRRHGEVAEPPADRPGTGEEVQPQVRRRRDDLRRRQGDDVQQQLLRQPADHPRGEAPRVPRPEKKLPRLKGTHQSRLLPRHPGRHAGRVRLRVRRAPDGNAAGRLPGRTRRRGQESPVGRAPT